MKPENQHWCERWRENRIGFHSSDINQYLQKYLPNFALPDEAAVFLPLCGKSNDIAWLADQGLNVIGVELSAIAIEAFFAEHELRYQSFESDRFVMRSCANIKLLEGDYFELNSDDLQGCALVFDRASLIALSAQQRVEYSRHLNAIMPPQCNIFLVALDYDQQQMSGPPYAVTATEVAQYFGDDFAIIELEKNDVLDELPRWREQGLTRLTETVYRLERKG
ncbi:MAG: thiopurine S-methyltransferase [Planctomycetota bacterium]|jgi:thiopurine S-methyltransferase